MSTATNKVKPRIKINWSRPSASAPPEPKKPVDAADGNFDGELKLEPVIDPKTKVERHPYAGPVTVPKQTIAQLADLESPPEGMDRKSWEKKICQERLCRIFVERMKSRFGVNVQFFTPAERNMFKNFYGYLQDLELAEQIVSYVIENWPGIKARYRLTFQYPVPGTFALTVFAKQIAVEYHRKRNVTTEDPVYISDFKEPTKDEQQYQSDW